MGFSVPGSLTLYYSVREIDLPAGIDPPAHDPVTWPALGRVHWLIRSCEYFIPG